MKEIDVKKLKQVEFMRKHSLSSEDRRKLIQGKLDRARAYHEAFKKREALFVESR